MVDWSASMQQSFEFYEVDPCTWTDEAKTKKNVLWTDKTKLTNIKSCTITRDAEVDTLGSATFDVTESIGECYVRVYLVTIQNGITTKHPLGTFLAQTPNSNFDGKVRTVSMDAYTPLIELKENNPPIGYFLAKDSPIMDHAFNLTEENARAPVVKPIGTEKLSYDFVADTNDSWLTFIRDLMSATHVETLYEVQVSESSYVRTGTILENVTNSQSLGVKTTTNEDVYSGICNDRTVYYCAIDSLVSYKFALDEMGRIMFAPEQDVDKMSPVWTYTDDNSSILYPELTIDHDIYGIPNVVEVIYSHKGVTNKDIPTTIISEIRNDDPNSPTSTVSRGREIRYRVTDPAIYGEVTQLRLDAYAKQVLTDLSTLECTITYTHGYCPVRLGDCIRFNYTRSGLTNVKAKVISQSIKCTTGCSVTEKAVFKTKLWEA